MNNLGHDTRENFTSDPSHSLCIRTCLGFFFNSVQVIWPIDSNSMPQCLVILVNGTDLLLLDFAGNSWWICKRLKSVYAPNPRSYYGIQKRFSTNRYRLQMAQYGSYFLEEPFWTWPFRVIWPFDLKSTYIPSKVCVSVWSSAVRSRLSDDSPAPRLRHCTSTIFPTHTHTHTHTQGLHLRNVRREKLTIWDASVCGWKDCEQTEIYQTPQWPIIYFFSFSHTHTHTRTPCICLLSRCIIHHQPRWKHT